jgi:transketolase
MENTSSLTFDQRVERLKEIAKTLRRHVVDMVYTAQSAISRIPIGGGLRGRPLFRSYEHRSGRPGLERPDRFVLSKGHACPIWYSALALRAFSPWRS